MKKLTFFILSMVLTGSLAAQTAGEMDSLLAAGELTYTQAARFVLRVVDAFPEDGDAFAAARANRWFSGRAQAEGPISLGDLSLLIMRAFGLKGGIMFTFMPSPRYACRELVYTRIILGRTDPGGFLSGREFLQILGRVLTLTGENEASARQRLAAEINAQLEALHVADTTAAVSDLGVTISLFNVNFQADSTRLENAEIGKIRNIAEILSAIQARNILVAGHTALAGTREGQIQISRDRAQAVAEYLVLLGARLREEITVEGYGAERPVADTSTEEGRALNRRVEIIILEKP
jgi:outer membrane protein OmpA-like peptidoglycan-associated protein